MNWGELWASAAPVIPVAALVTLTVNWISNWFTKPRPKLVIEGQLTSVPADHPPSMPARETSAIAVTNVGNGPAYHLTFDGHLCDAAVSLPALAPGWTKERLNDWHPKLDPGETLLIRLAYRERNPQVAVVLKWRSNPGRSLVPPWTHMKTAKLNSLRIAAFFPLGTLEPQPLPTRFRKWRDLSRYSTRREEWRILSSRKK